VLALVSVTNGGDSNPNPDRTSVNFFSIPGLTSNIILATYPSTPGQTTSSGIPKRSPLSITTIALICLFGGGALVIALATALATGYCCLMKRHKERKNQLRFGRPPADLAYTPTVTNMPGSIFSWSSQVPKGAPPTSNYSGPTATSYPVSEISYGTRH
jgi:hypothetical protein